MGFAIAGVALALVGTAISTYSAVQQISAQKQAAETESKLRAQEAQSERASAAYEEAQFRRRAGLLLAKQHAALVATGLETDTGSPLLLELDSAKQTELEALNVRAVGARRAQASNFEAALATSRANFYGTQKGLTIGAGAAQAGSSILGGLYMRNSKSATRSATRPIAGGYAPGEVY